jgi:hypothetical protein
MVTGIGLMAIFLKSERNQIAGRPRRSQTCGLPELTYPFHDCDVLVTACGRVAERVGFEPTVRFPAHTLSKRAP